MKSSLFTDLLPESMTQSDRDALFDAIQECKPERALRLHKLTPEAFLSWYNEIYSQQPPPHPILWADGCFYLPEHMKLGLHPLHIAGAFYLQEPSAMAPVSALDIQPGCRVLDLCAAPGGKAGQIAAALAVRNVQNDGGFLLANELQPARAVELRANLQRLGVTNAVVMQESADRLAERFAGYFDRILVDAPCSGEGMFRRSPAAVRSWSQRAVEGCAARQRTLLESACAMLRPGGLMVYSTCTFNRIENEGTVLAFLGAHDEFAAEDFGLTGLPPSKEGMLRLMPHQGFGEGQFMARLRKRDYPRNSPPVRRQIHAATERVTTVERDSFERFRADNLPGLNLRDGFQRLGGHICALPPGCTDPERWTGLRVLAAGVDLGDPHPHGWEPAHALAMALKPSQARYIAALDDQMAVSWLAGHDLPLNDSSNDSDEIPSCKWGLTEYRGMPLGFGKINKAALKNRLPFTVQARLS
ncbi:ribosomal RNA small subunit methyltransferase F [Clostridia bacterium]|nr:ribosomal RNA small subunit methyltransferase F [Clostridia bacterium]